jgi:hypothetical protein
LGAGVNLKLCLFLARDAERLLDEWLYRRELAVALPQQFPELEGELRDRRGWWIDREEPFLDPHQRQVESARLVRLGMARALELRQDPLGLVSRFVHRKADILMDDAHRDSVEVGCDPDRQSRGGLWCDADKQQGTGQGDLAL